MMNVFQEIKGMINARDLLPKIICLLFSVILWAYIGSTQMGEIRFKLPVEIKNLPPAFILLDNQNSSVTMLLKGRKDDLKNINIKNIKAFVNLENPVLGDDVKYTMDLIKTEIPDNISYTITPSKISLTVERKITRKIKISPQFIGDIKEGFIIGLVRTYPDSVMITGPESLVNSIDSLPTTPIAADKDTKDTGKGSKEVPIDKENLRNLTVAAGNVTVQWQLMETSGLSRMDAKIGVRNPSAAYHYELSHSYAAVYLKIMKENIIPGEGDLEVFVDIPAGEMERHLREKNNSWERECMLTVYLKRKGDLMNIVQFYPNKILVKIIKKG